VNGSNDKMKIRIIGGGGEDLFENTSKNSAVKIYDRTDGNNKVTGPFRNKFANDTMVNRHDRIYYKYPYQSFFATVGYNPDDGIFLGPTFKYIRHGFRKDPYRSFHQFKGLYAFSTKAFYLRYNNEFIGVFGYNTDIITDFEYRGPNGTTNFFGYGVNSVYDKSKPGKFRYYRIRYDLGDVALQLRHRFSNKVMLAIGPNFQFYNMDADDKLNKVRNVVENTVAVGLNPATVFEKQSYIGVKATFTVDTRNSQVLPEKGINWVTNFRSLKGLSAASYDGVSQLSSDFSFYFNLIKDRLIFANRVGGGITMSDDAFEFFHAQYLGNEDNLRGFRKHRFAGKSKFYNQAELRLKIANLKTYLFPAAFGIYGFLDAGRVWVKNDNDSKMLTGYGGGIWFSPLRRIVLTLSYAKSKEDGMPLFGMGWKF
jgi:hemolysin activation/secretion protein